MSFARSAALIWQTCFVTSPSLAEAESFEALPASAFALAASIAVPSAVIRVFRASMFAPSAATCGVAGSTRAESSGRAFFTAWTSPTTVLACASAPPAAVARLEACCAVSWADPFSPSTALLAAVVKSEIAAFSDCWPW